MYIYIRTTKRYLKYLVRYIHRSVCLIQSYQQISDRILEIVERPPVSPEAKEIIGIGV